MVVIVDMELSNPIEVEIVELQKGNPYSPSTIRKNIKYAVMDKELYELLQDESNQATLRDILINRIK